VIDEVFLVSIYISPDYYRRGVATAALGYIGYIFAESTLYAEIDPENVASVSLFENAGYRYNGDEGAYIREPAKKGCERDG
jgi:RimJ/RimL family protein N-acetyltransferase